MHVLIIGAYGSAGVAAAERLAEHVGDEIDRLTLVDDGDPGGGLCILRGCMPSKEVLSAAAHRYQARRDRRLRGSPPTIDLAEVVAVKNRHVSNFAEHRRAAVHRLAERDGVKFLRGTATFEDDRTVVVTDADAVDEDAGEEPLRFDPDYVIVATGSAQNVPDLDGIEDVDYLTSSDVLDATELPSSGVVLGFGYVGLELVPYLVEAGVEELTVIEHDERPLDEADPAYGDELLDLYREEFGVEILTNTSERSVEPTDDGGVRVYVESDGAGAGGGDDYGDAGYDGEGDDGCDDSCDDCDRGESGDGSDGDTGSHDVGDGVLRAIEADALFAFTGRRPSLDRLGLENTALEPGPGWVDETMRAVDDERVFVVGDANGKEPILHVAKEQGFTAADNVLAVARGEPLVEYRPLHPHVIFSGATVYPYARVGHAEWTAEEAGLDYVAVTREASDDGVFKTKEAPRGHATLIVDAVDGTVLGYQGLHYHADVMAKTMQVVVELGLDVRDLPDRAYHPTTPEILDGLFREAKRKLS
jgi:dihydrolipoamide dehydrogenase